MKKNKPETLCVHEGQIEDPIYNGAVSPLYMATAYSYKKGDMYPRYFNTPNQVGLSKKISSPLFTIPMYNAFLCRVKATCNSELYNKLSVCLL